LTSDSTALLAALAGRAAAPMAALYEHISLEPHPKTLRPSEVQRQARMVMDRAQSQAVLIDDAPTTLVIENWTAWNLEQRMGQFLCDLVPGEAENVAEIKEAMRFWTPQDTCLNEIAAVFEPHPEPPDADFSATDVHRSYRTILDAAKERPVFIEARASLFTVDVWDRRRLLRSALRLFRDVVQFESVRRLRPGRPASEWAMASPYPWVASLPDEEVGEFAGELLPYLLEAVRRRDLSGFFGNLEGWITAAQIHGSEQLQGRLASPSPPGAALALPSPSDVGALGRFQRIS
jgi:hypothetical protein